jgi:anti-sigma regulatory factor (Ser/Thr protein kinase)
MPVTTNSSSQNLPSTPDGRPVAGLVELTIPVGSDLLVLARLAASTVASRSEFDIEEIEDLRLAVDELCISVLEGRRTGTLRLRFDGQPGQIEVVCLYDGPAPSSDDSDRTDDGEDPETGDLSGRILDALVDEHGAVVLDGLTGARLCKRRLHRDA